MSVDKNEQSWINIFPFFPKCPHCVNGHLENRIRRGFFVRHFFVWMDVKRYQCNTCGRKVYVKNSSVNQGQRQLSKI